MTELVAGYAIDVFVVSIVVGVVVGLTGLGGGALMTPGLIMLGIPAPAAVANDLVSASVTKSVGAAVHWRGRSPNLRLAGWLICGSVPPAFAGAWIIRATGTSSQQEHFVTVALGCILLFTAATYLVKIYVQHRQRTREGTTRQGEPTIRPTATLLVGAGGGFLVGISSVGSGSLIMAALLLLYPTMSAVRLVGTDLVQAVPLVLAAATSHVMVTGVDWDVLLPLLLGGTPGTFLGAQMADRVPQNIIRSGIVIMLSLAGLKMLGVSPANLAVIAVILLLLVTSAAVVVRRSGPPHSRRTKRRHRSRADSA